jgi:chromate transporter
MILLDLFFSFFRIGLFTFGGGYAMIPLLEQEAINRGWLTASEFTDIIAISNITPGPLAVNMATFVGFQQASVLGAFIATVGVSMPSLILVIIVMRFLHHFKENKYIDWCLFGIRAAVAGLVITACVNIALPLFLTPDTSLTTHFIGINYLAILFFIMALVCFYRNAIKPIPMIIMSGFLGILIF